MLVSTIPPYDSIFFDLALPLFESKLSFDTGKVGYW